MDILANPQAPADSEDEDHTLLDLDDLGEEDSNAQKRKASDMAGNDEVAPIPAKRKRSAYRQRSGFRDHFEEDPNEPGMMKCKHCPEDVPKFRTLYNGTKVTTRLRTHMLDEHPSLLKEHKETENTHSDVRTDILLALATSNVPFSFVNNEHLQRAFNRFDPSFKLGDRRFYATGLLDEEYSKAYKEVQAALKDQSVSLTCDHWSSRDNNHSIMGGTATFIDDSFKRHTYIISIEEISDSHDSEQVKEYMGNVQDEYKVKDVISAVTDSARVMEAGIRKANIDRFLDI